MLFLLRLRDEGDWDELVGMVVRADGRDHARLVASQGGDCEFSREWLNPDETSCEALEPDGPPAVILKDRNSA